MSKGLIHHAIMPTGVQGLLLVLLPAIALGQSLGAPHWLMQMVHPWTSIKVRSYQGTGAFELDVLRRYEPVLDSWMCR